METVFLKLVNLSITASWLVLAVLVLRLVFRRAPRWIFCLLWGLVALRLACPFSLESALSLIPSAQTLPEEILYTATPHIQSGIPAVNSAVNPFLAQSMVPAPGASVNPTQVWSFVLAWVWAAGAAVMALYALVSYLLIRRRMATATLLRENIKQSEQVDSPFVLGFLRPTIYLPYGVGEADLTYVIAHEQAHIRRRDHWWKPLGFALLAVYWFNPLLWLAYVLLCRDIEGACDEKVIREMGQEDRRGYASALLHCSVHRRRLAACPLAFGEVGVKERVKWVMDYRRPAFWLAAAALVACAAAAVCFLTDPAPGREFPMEGTDIAQLQPGKIVERLAKLEKLEAPSQLCANKEQFGFSLTADFQWNKDQAVRFFYGQGGEIYSAQLRIFPEDSRYFVTEAEQWPEQDTVFSLEAYLQAVKYLPREEIRQLSPQAEGYFVDLQVGGAPADFSRSITYTSGGAGPVEGWLIHLAVSPSYGGGQATTAEEIIHLFYGGENTAPAVTCWLDYTGSPWEMDWDGELTTEIPQFPGVTFRYTPGQITAQSSDETEPAVLFTGMPIWNVYFCDLTGDGLPEICATLSWGSGMIDTRVTVYDYAQGVSYHLEDRGTWDYSLRYSQTDGLLYVDQRAYSEGELAASGPLVYENGLLRLQGGGDEAAAYVQRVTTLPGSWDFDHDGSPERVDLVAVDEEVPWYWLMVLGGEGELLWEEEAYAVHSGYRSIFACSLEGEDYLLEYYPTMYQGCATYAYELFSLDTAGNPVTEQEGSVSFDLNWGSPSHQPFDGEAVADFMDEVNGLLAQGRLLLTTDPALEGIDPDHPRDDLWWLQDGTGGYVYDPDLTLRENLLALEGFAED